MSPLGSAMGTARAASHWSGCPLPAFNPKHANMPATRPAPRSELPPQLEPVQLQIATIEGLATGTRLRPMQQAVVPHDGFQCAHRTPGLALMKLQTEPPRS